MYDLSQPNQAPGKCGKCGGTGRYNWGGTVNGKSRFSGTCFSCKGTGKQTAGQIKTNHTYNRYKIAEIARAEFVRDPGEDAEDRWNEQYR